MSALDAHQAAWQQVPDPAISPLAYDIWAGAEYHITRLQDLLPLVYAAKATEMERTNAAATFDQLFGPILLATGAPAFSMYRAAR